MKKFLLYITFLLIFGSASAQISYFECDNNNDGVTTFDLTVSIPQILAGDSADDYIISFHETYDDADSDMNPITNPQNYSNVTPGQQTIYARKESVATGDAEVEVFIISITPAPGIGNPIDLYNINSVFNLTINTVFLQNNNPASVTYFTTQADAEANLNVIANPQAYTAAPPVETIWARLENGMGCFSITSFEVYTDTEPIVNIPDANFKTKLLQANTNNTIAKNANGQNMKIDINNDNEIQFSEAIMVAELNVYNSDIEDLTGIEAFTSITHLYVGTNNLTILDLSNNPLLEVFWAYDNPNLMHINIQNGTALNPQATDNGSWMEIWGNLPNGVYICADASEVEFIEQYLNNWNATGQVVSTFCDFDPEQVTISGMIRFDAEGNGCNGTGTPLDYIPVFINDGENGGYTFTQSGNYTFYTGTGSFDITPVVENDYFTFSPAAATVDATTEGELYTQDFCLTANGEHADAAVYIVPLQPAVPGFTVNYQIIYVNKGNQTLSGAVTFAYDDALLDYISASVNADVETSGMLTWNYTGLLPFETREVTVQFEVNTPTETPAVNSGDILTYTAEITHALTDETPADNTYTYDAVVVNSYDPNNIICLEGENEPMEAIGEYLHYVVNFENTGDFPATNISVQVEINTEDYDVSSLRLISGSDDVEAHVNGTIAEFVFEGINLQAGAHGNVVFKIKTKASLEAGDQVASHAAIYFDFNFPIMTNDAETTFTTLSTADFTKNAVEVYPNPANTFITVRAVNNIQKAELYDLQGRKLEELQPDAAEAVFDLSQRATGIYMIKVTTQKGVSATKIIKN